VTERSDAHRAGLPLEATVPAKRRRKKRSWRWLLGLLVTSAGTATGTILMVLPWLPDWDQNFFSGSSQSWFALWMNFYFRGAISGVGAVNVYAALAETADLLRSPGARDGTGASPSQ
jgi:hypothetical protein